MQNFGSDQLSAEEALQGLFDGNNFPFPDSSEMRGMWNKIE